MNHRTDLEKWQKACIAYQKQDYDAALKTFINLADNAKMHFNIGLIFAAIEDHERALVAYERAVQLDPYLAVSYFQMGVSLFILDQFENASQQFDMALQTLRENKVINYQQLGLGFRLYRCEVLFNRGICKLFRRKIDDGLTDLYNAQKEKMTDEHDVIDQAVRDRGDGYSVFSIPPGVLFRPTQSQLKRMKSVELLLMNDNSGISTTRLPHHTTSITRNNSMLRPLHPVKSNPAKSFLNRMKKKSSSTTLSSSMSRAAQATADFSRPGTPDHGGRRSEDSSAPSPPSRRPYVSPQQQRLRVHTDDLPQNHHPARQYSPTERSRTGMAGESYYHDDIPPSASTASTASYGRFRTDSEFDLSNERYSSSSSTGRSSTKSYKASQDLAPPVPFVPRAQSDTCGPYEHCVSGDVAYDELWSTMNSMTIDNERAHIRGRLNGSEGQTMDRRGSSNSNSSSVGRTQSPLSVSSTPMVSNNSVSLKVKIYHESHDGQKNTHCLAVSPNIGFEELKEKVYEKCNVLPSLPMQYKDDEDDLVIMNDEDDLSMAKIYAGLGTLKIWIKKTDTV